MPGFVAAVGVKVLAGIGLGGLAAATGVTALTLAVGASNELVVHRRRDSSERQIDGEIAGLRNEVVRK